MAKQNLSALQDGLVARDLILGVDPSPVSITGPMLLGHLLNYTLMGTLGIQVYVYFLSFKKDPLFIKAMVCMTALIDVIQTCFSGHYAWYVLAEGWGNPDALRFTSWSVCTIPPLAGTIAFMVQLFYGSRILVLGKYQRPYRLWASFIALPGLVAFVASWASGIESGRNRDAIMTRNVSELTTPVTIWLASSVGCDVLLTLTLVFQLVSAQSSTSFKNTQDMIKRTIRMTVETNAITSAVVVLELVLYLNSSTTSWYFICGMSIGKFYSNSLLALLNSRARKNDESGTIVIESLVWRGRGITTNDHSVASNVTNHNGIMKTISTRTDRDVELASFSQVEPESTFGNYKTEV